MTDVPLQVHDIAGVRVVALGGDVDVLVAPHVAARLPELMDDVRALVLDLADVTFFDSSGVRLVDDVARGCAGRAIAWRVVAPAGGPSRRVLELVGMAGLQVVEDRATALAQVLP